jgi:hypothetical protein
MSTLKTTNIAHPSSGSNNIVLDSSGNATLATAKITTLADSAGSNTSTPAAIAAGIAKAWVNFNGTTASPSTIRASYNVSSVTKNASGDYTVNFTTAMVDANYVTTGSCQRVSGASEGILTIYAVNLDGTLVAPTTSAARVNTSQRAAGVIDSAYVNVVIFR